MGEIEREIWERLREGERWERLRERASKCKAVVYINHKQATKLL